MAYATINELKVRLGQDYAGLYGSGDAGDVPAQADLDAAAAEIDAAAGLGRLETFPKTVALSLSGEGVVSIPDGDELRLGSLTVDGTAFPCGRYTYETAPAALKAHLADDTTGSIVIGRIGTLFMIQ